MKIEKMSEFSVSVLPPVLWSVDGTVIQYSNEYSNNWNICNIYIVVSDIGILGRNAQPVKTAIHVSNCRKPTFLSVQATSQL